jgi:RNA polymerase sigma-70 factor, ECF subfamily
VSAQKPKNLKKAMAHSALPQIDILELETHRQSLYRYALRQLRNEDHAQDCVQDTLLVALQSSQHFGGNSSVRTWLVGILKHKIIDHFRTVAREQPLDLDEEDMSLEDLDGLFKEDGHFMTPPLHWANPEHALSQRRFFEVLEHCMDELPKAAAQVFHMREVMGLDTGEICSNLAITPNNCWVLLYRARIALRSCLEQCWFLKES